MTTEQKSWSELPEAEWDGKCMIYSELTKLFRSTPKEAFEDFWFLDAFLEGNQQPANQWIHDNLDTIAELGGLFLTTPIYAVLPEDLFNEHMDGDGNLPEGLQKAIDEFNAKKIVLEWEPIDIRLKVTLP